MAAFAAICWAASSWGFATVLLHRLLLGSDGALVCGRGDERTLDCASGAACSSGKAGPIRTVDRACRWCCLRRRRCRNAFLQVSGSCLWLNAERPFVAFTDTRNECRHVCFWGQTGHSAGWPRLPVLTRTSHSELFP